MIFQLGLWKNCFHLLDRQQFQIDGVDPIRWCEGRKWTNAAFFHKKYAKLYLENLPRSLASTIESYTGCEHLLMNFLVSHVTKQAPIKVTQRKKYKDITAQRDVFLEAEQFSQKQTCMNIFSSGFGYMPLVRSQLRLDPVLFKDPVSNLRKKFRKIELVQWLMFYVIFYNLLTLLK